MPVPMLSVTSISVDAVKPADMGTDQTGYRVRAKMKLTMPAATPAELRLRIDYLSETLPQVGLERISRDVLRLLRDQIDAFLLL